MLSKIATGIAAAALLTGIGLASAGTASASTLGGPSGYGYIATFQNQIECLEYGNSHVKAAGWADWVCAATFIPGGTRYELYAI